MESVLEYMVNKHRTLTTNYKTPDNQYSESCGLIAIDIAKRLLEEGKIPCIMQIFGKIIDSEGNRKSIIPKQYDGKVIWGAHQICCAEGKAYDPMISQEPVMITDYFQMTFIDDVDTKILINQEEIRKFVER